MIDLINAAAALLTIAFGGFGFLAPRFTASALDLATTTSTMGLTEMRASVGGLFVVSGLYCLLVGGTGAYFMLGVAYSGAALGRAVSLAMDAPPQRKTLAFGGIEAALAVWLIFANSAV